jgi:hypothetical protein
MHGKNPTRTGDSMVYSSVQVALVSRRRSRSGRVKGMPIVGVLRRVWIPPVTVSWVRIIFKSEERPAGAGSQVDQVSAAEVNAHTHCLDKSA